ncbi:carbohydrate ABC transporter permease [Actinacidiphila guanduensis]|uniref:Carbohydrate ABC transporter membrane protein 1, CUT1 family n=1 Tax=Actinacidiphila guanduensis TaxID=310781 RepID=A0A1G9WCL7_9ACTN|nr:sugar ABC transporter permease [Actinacidiphila guanduensis]SDM82013.1 carbohydrate ABC transporter membrane protein 1, CUT1 family [Actinacidiphila guanduensis]
MSSRSSTTDEPPPLVAPAARRRAKAPAVRKGGDGRFAFWLVVPAMLVLTAVIGYPIVAALIRSLSSDTLGESPHFVGFGNYADALWGARSGQFWDSVEVTYLFAAITIVLETAIGLGMALVMNQAFRGRSLLRGVVLVPWAVPTAVAAVLWKWSFNPVGIINAVTGSHVVWTGADWPSRIAIIVADTWKTSPFIALLILAGLQVIPHDVYEAAELDGAGAFQRFRLITLPLVRPALLVAVLFRLLDALRMYDLPAILTHGANDTTTLSILVVQSTLSELKPGYGGALSTLTFLFIFVTAYAFVRLLGVDATEAHTRDSRKARS